MSELLLFPGPEAGPEDAAARRAALDPERSILVQAPAGAGKTNLLTERFLALLARVEEPEQILAITFTRAATAEMRGRILGSLEAAARGAEQAEPLRTLAGEALRHSERMGWKLLEQPHRFQVETIDSLCLRLAHGQPLLARLGGALAPTEDAEALWKQAARRTTGLLDGSLKGTLGHLLLRRDNNLPEMERLLAGMLARRDAWLGALPLRFDEEVDWAAVRARLEAPFREENRLVLCGLETFFHISGALGTELLALGRYAAANLDRVSPLSGCEGCPADVEQWLAVADLLLTREGTPRKQWTVREGFPAGGTKSEKERAQEFKQRMKDCCLALCGDEAFLKLLGRLRRLPPPGYSEDQWQTLTAVLAVLRRAAAELRLVFAEANAVDFVEIARAAEQVLRDEASMRGLLESERKRHILIDEFQDTSRTQYALVAQLLKEWTPGDGRTAFVVGDPLQSIYGFRQAEVALFHETRERGLPCGDGGDTRHACHPLQLTHNFRSHAGLVGELNRRFDAIFEGGQDKFVAAQAEPSPDRTPSFQVHAFEETEESEGEEAARVVEVLRAELPRVAEAEAAGKGEYRVAVLVRSRPHLRAILPALRAAGIRYRAVDLEPLAGRPEIVDLHALLRALLHPGDRVAWLTVLRAPWAGLTLPDLHTLAGSDDPELALRPFVELIPARMHLLSAEGQTRVERVWAVLQAAPRTRYAGLSLAAWVERTWMGLGGPACVGPTERENAEAFLRLLDRISLSGIEVLDGSFEAALGKLSAAPDCSVSERFGVQVMTIHKAKGLGFEVVLVPGLARQPRANGGELVAFLERGAGDLLLAPIGSREESEDPLYAWVQGQKRERDAAERKRLFYVACTRARTRLHLFGAVRVKDGEVRRPGEGSLLEAAWAGLEADFRARLGSTGTGLRLAAAAEPVVSSPGRTDAAMLERLPSGWVPGEARPDVRRGARGQRRPLFTRAEGSAASMVRGRVLHALLEELGRGASEPAQLLRAARRESRAGGLAPGEEEALVRAALAAAATEVGRWIFRDRLGGSVERGYELWDGDGNLRTLRLDRVFTAGASLLSEGATHRWVVDYKTGTGAADVSDAWRAEQKALYAGQMEAYAEAAAEGLPVRCALFYPEPGEVVWWAADMEDADRKGSC